LCKWDARALRAFLVPALAFCLLGLGGMALTGMLSGAWWPLVAYEVACKAIDAWQATQ
jgi:hypothetical protein